jgi:mannose/cellobiose epimerase-like protein (N-acyl-D-glucosamine 2-epimerase family)
MSVSALQRRAREAHAWLHEACFPLWADTGVTKHGLFREALTLDHRARETPDTRVRVQARQTYVFAEALRQGWEPAQARERVEMGIATLGGAALRADGLAGRSLAATGLSLSDDTADLYDNAFALFALAHAVAALGSDGAGARAAAAALLAAIDRALKDDARGGYAEMLPPPSVRTQNPHMHLFEAALAWHDVAPNGGHLARANALRALFDTRLTAGQGGLLGERFSADWGDPGGNDAEQVEPGHQFEWVWLLHTHARRLGAPLPPAALRLYNFAMTTLDPAGRAIMMVTRAGAPIDASARTWSQTEALKAQLALYEHSREARYADAAVQTFDVLMDQFLTDSGGWNDHLDAAGTTLARDMPASTGYHVVLAFAELLRLFHD